MCLLDVYGSTFHHISISYNFWPHQPPPKQNTFRLSNWNFRKSFLWFLKESNEYWTHKVKFDNFLFQNFYFLVFVSYDNHLHMKNYVFKKNSKMLIFIFQDSVFKQFVWRVPLKSFSLVILVSLKNIFKMSLECKN